MEYSAELRQQADVLFQTFLGQIRIFARQKYTGDDVHGLGHVERVLKTGKKIMAVSGGYPALLETLTWLHDIGRAEEKARGEHHAQISADMAGDYFRALGFPPKIIDLVTAGILSHSFSVGGEAEYLEAQILSDADKLDATGAVGIFRASCHHYSNAEGLQQLMDHFDEKLLILGGKLYLEESKNMVSPRIGRLRQFKLDLLEELE